MEYVSNDFYDTGGFGGLIFRRFQAYEMQQDFIVL